MKILVLGASGAGTSTLGAALAAALRLALTAAALARHANAVVSGSPLGWGASVENAFDHVVFVTLAASIRLERLRARELAKRGEVNAAFLAWAASYDDEAFAGRSRKAHEAWLAGRHVTRVDGGTSTNDQVAYVLRALGR